jgi:hypothetical protein
MFDVKVIGEKIKAFTQVRKADVFAGKRAQRIP